MAAVRIPQAPGRRFWVPCEWIEEQDWRRRADPRYSVHEVAKFFFAMSPSWLRLHLTVREGYPQTSFVLDGQPMEFARRPLQCKVCKGRGKPKGTNLDCRNCEGKGTVEPPDGQDTGRVFLLSDIEPMALSLRKLTFIDDGRLAHIIDVVIAEGTLYGLIK
jgi:hypothetical protein